MSHVFSSPPTWERIMMMAKKLCVPRIGWWLCNGCCCYCRRPLPVLFVGWWGSRMCHIGGNPPEDPLWIPTKTRGDSQGIPRGFFSSVIPSLPKRLPFRHEKAEKSSPLYYTVAWGGFFGQLLRTYSLLIADMSQQHTRIPPTNLGPRSPAARETWTKGKTASLYWASPPR